MISGVKGMKLYIRQGSIGYTLLLFKMIVLLLGAMLNRISTLIWVALAFQFFASCKTDEPPATEVLRPIDYPDWSTRFEMIVHEKRDSTELLTRFFGSGLDEFFVTAEFLDRTVVTFNGQELTWDADLRRYRLDLPGLITQGTFIWGDQAFERYDTIAVEVAPLRLPESLSRISRAEAIEVRWVGDALADLELASMFIDSGPSHPIVKLNANQTGTELFRASKETLQKVPTGEASVTVERVWTKPIEGTFSAGGLVKGRYYASVMEVEILD